MIEAISVVIPAWNEEQRISGSLSELVNNGTRWGIQEIVVVDDGSSDRTAEIIRSYLESGIEVPRLRLISCDVNRGKGAALRRGLVAASCPLVGYLDADLSIGPESLPAASAALADGADAVAGYRLSYTGLSDGKGQPGVRRLLSAVFKGIQRSLIGLPIRDTQCPFKLFTRAAIARAVPQCQSDGWAFDVELLVVAATQGMKIVELPVPWEFRGGSTVRADFETAWITLRDLFALRRRHGKVKLWTPMKSTASPTSRTGIGGTVHAGQ